MIVLSVPDWGVTPLAASREPNRIAAEIDRCSEANREGTENAGARYANLTVVSRQAFANRELVAADSLQPSAKMCADWVSLVLPHALAALGRASP